MHLPNVLQVWLNENHSVPKRNITRPILSLGSLSEKKRHCYSCVIQTFLLSVKHAIGIS